MTVGALSRRRSDRGSASVLVLALAAVIVVLAGALATLGVVVTARARAQAVADVAALAAAARAQRVAFFAPDDAPPGTPCRLADEVAMRHHAALTACIEEGAGVVRVTVSVATPVGAATAEARAGPRS